MSKASAILQFQSTRPVRGGTSSLPPPHDQHNISIHPPRAGRDYMMTMPSQPARISIHPPRAGRDAQVPIVRCGGDGFQSTRPVWGGTIIDGRNHVRQTNFNPPAPCGAGPRWHLHPRLRSDFNPPAPCGAGLALRIKQRARELFQSTRPVRGGTSIAGDGISNSVFQSTRPVRGGTVAVSSGCRRWSISIHPPRAGRDFRGI